MNSSAQIPPPPAPVTAGAIPWYKSADQKRRIIAGVLVVAVYFAPRYKIVHALGLDDLGKLTGYVYGIADAMPVLIAIGSAAFGFAKRWHSPIQPLTFTAAKAASHPATIAVKEVQAEMQAAHIDTAVVRQAKIEATGTFKTLGDQKS